MFHNEAVVAIDLVVQARAIAAGVNTPPDHALPGDSWLVGPAPTDAWGGRAQHLAGWTEGGWRFAAPVEGMTVWVSDRGLPARYRDGVWGIGDLAGARVTIGGEQVLGARGKAIAAPAGGAVVDVEARTAIAALLAMARTHGLIAT
jgi:hypothetical protein